MALPTSAPAAISDRSERAHVRHPLHLQRAAGVPRLLAHLLHHGRPVLQRTVPQVRGRGRRTTGRLGKKLEG